MLHTRLAAVGLATVLLSASLCACGSSKTHTAALSPAARAAKIPPESPQTKADADHDGDLEAPGNDNDNSSTFDFGHAADAADTRAITTLITHYYADAAAENAVAGCSLLYSTTAEYAPEDQGTSPPGPVYSQGTTCAQVLMGVFRHFHPQLVLEVPKLHVLAVRLEGHHGIAVLGFGSMPEHRISFEREGHVWRITTLYDISLP
jgi:hypothetical protein